MGVGLIKVCVCFSFEFGIGGDSFYGGDGLFGGVGVGIVFVNVVVFGDGWFDFVIGFELLGFGEYVCGIVVVVVWFVVFGECFFNCVV